MKQEQWSRDAFALARQLPAYTKLLLSLYREPALSPGQKLRLTGGLLYAASPVDLLPFPVIGQLDDLIVLIIAIRRALDSLPPDLAQYHLSRAGLTYTDLEDDLKVSKRLLKQAGKSAARLVAKGLVRTVRLVLRQGKRKFRMR